MRKLRLRIPATLRVLAVGTAVLACHTQICLAQPEPHDTRPSDLELRKRLEPLVPAIRAALLGDNPDSQRAALAILADIPPGLAATGNISPAVTAFLQKDVKDPSILALGLRAYGKTYPDAPDVTKIVGRHIHSDQVEVRQASAESLSSLIENSIPSGRSLPNATYFLDMSKAALPLLGNLIEDKNFKVQKLAVGGTQNATRVVTELYSYDASGAIDDIRPKDRFAPVVPVLKALTEIAPKLASPLASDDVETRVAAAGALETMAVLRKFIITSSVPDAGAKSDPFIAAWPALGPTLAKRMHDSNYTVRLAVTEALESIGDAIEVRALLREATTDASPYVRWTAARALGRDAPTKPVPATVAADVAALAKLASDKDMDVRTAALNALGHFGSAGVSAGPAVLAAAGVGDVEPRVAAIKAIDSLKTDTASTLPVLIAALKDKDLRLQRAAAMGLVRFGPDARPALPELRAALKSTDAEVRLAAAEAILAIEGKRAVKEL